MSDANYRPKGSLSGDSKGFGSGNSMAAPYKLGGSLAGKSESEVKAGYCAHGKISKRDSGSDGMDGA
jgi:hypothetical protein